MKTLDIITSALNEEACLPEFFSRIRTTLQAHPEISWRVLICDNGSTDQTWEIILKENAEDSRVVGFKLSRNFELDSAFSCGIDHATADMAIIMVSDLQDPPELIPTLVAHLENGFEQVVVRITKRESVPYFYRFFSSAFYSIANRATSGMIPRNVSDFRIMKKSAYQSARLMRERNRFLRGLIAWGGFKTNFIEIERPARFAGESKFQASKLSKIGQWAIKAVLAHTTTPLLAISIVGIGFGIISGLSTFIFSCLWIFFGVPFAGFGTIIGVITLGFSLILLSLGIMAQYLALIYEEVKQRPLYLISETTLKDES